MHFFVVRIPAGEYSHIISNRHSMFFIYISWSNNNILYALLWTILKIVTVGCLFLNQLRMYD